MLNRIVRKIRIEIRLFLMVYYRYLPLFLKTLIAVFNSEFWNSNRAVMEGISQHLLRDKQENGNRFRLRRYTHMIEKGLSHRSTKAEFGINYIERAVNQYSRLAMSSSIASSSVREELQWSHDVLFRYFEYMKDSETPALLNAKDVFYRVPKKLDDMGFSPQLRIDAPAVDITALTNLGLRRRSVRFYLDIPVPVEKINAALTFASLSPSACNRQPYRIFYFDEPEKVRKISSLAPGAVSFANGIPAIAVIVGDFSAYEFEKDRSAIYVDGAMASMCLILGLEVQGLSSCCLNWPQSSGLNDKAAEVLRLKPWERIVMMLAIGYPDESVQVPFSQKHKPQELGRFNREIY